MPHVVLAVGYDHLGDETSLSATIAGTADFLNNYTYDSDGELTQVTQQGQTGGNTVTPKLVNFAYNADGLYTTISRYANLAATQLVATSTYGYDADGEITSLSHDKGATNLNAYTWTYDHAGRVMADSSSDGTDSYSYDASGQETAATHSYATNENYSYDANGNRSNTGYTTGTNNEVTSDGTYDYSYGNEGNLIQKTDISTGAYTTYTWDYHNRLTDVENYTSGGTLTFHEHYVYDIYDRLIGTQTDPTGGGTYTSSQCFVYDAGGIAGANSSPPSQGGVGGVGSSVILVFNGSGTLTDRLLVVSPSGGSSASMFLADENASNVASWALPDNEGSIRDVVQYNSTTDTTSDVDHLVYDSVGNITSQTNSAYQPLFAYAGMLIDAGSGFRYDHARWYNPQLGTFITQDPTAFAGADSNLYRYVDNSPMNGIDPTGMMAMPAGGFAATPNLAMPNEPMITQMQAQANAQSAAQFAATQQAMAAAEATMQQTQAQMNVGAAAFAQAGRDKSVPTGTPAGFDPGDGKQDGDTWTSKVMYGPVSTGLTAVFEYTWDDKEGKWVLQRLTVRYHIDGPPEVRVDPLAGDNLRKDGTPNGRTTVIWDKQRYIYNGTPTGFDPKYGPEPMKPVGPKADSEGWDAEANGHPEFDPNGRPWGTVYEVDIPIPGGKITIRYTLKFGTDGKVEETILSGGRKPPKGKPPDRIILPKLPGWLRPPPPDPRLIA